MARWLAGNKHTDPPASKLRIQTSLQGVIRPIVWGQTRISGNLIDYQDFHVHEPSGGKGGVTGVSGKGANAGTTYSVTVAIGLCEGPITNVTGMWENKNFGTLSQFHFTLFNGSYTQGPWGYMTTAHPTHALNYRGLAYAAQANVSLGSAPEIPQISWEVLSTISYALGTSPTIVQNHYGVNPANWPQLRQGSLQMSPTSVVPDANPKDVIIDFLTNPHYGAGWPSDRLDLVMNDYSSACRARPAHLSRARRIQGWQLVPAGDP